MATLTSGNLIEQAKRVVIKIGSALLVEGGALRDVWLRSLAADISGLKARGKDVIVVSSGSIALGRAVMAMGAGALSLDKSQAAAAVGQIRLARAYQEALQPFGIETGQVLLTLEDSQNRRRYLNTRATLKALLEMGVVPIVNENDTVATDEIRYGDNDRLGAQVASLIGADVLVLLSDVDGLYTADPRLGEAEHIPLVREITPQIEAMAGDAGSDGAKGGMKTKVMAAKVAMMSGCAMVICKGAGMNPIERLEQGAMCSWFKADTTPATARKLWISGMKPMGVLVIDAGALRALKQGRSLLSAGVVRVEGVFGRGDPVEITDESGTVFAKALAGYNSDEAQVLAGCQSHEIKDKLGYPGRAAQVHRDDMAI